MAIAVEALRTAITEVMEGDMGTLRPEPGVFEYGAFEGQPLEAMLAKLRQTSTATHWFDVRVGEHRTHEASAISARMTTRLAQVPITIDVFTGLKSEPQESERSTILAQVMSDCETAAQALAYVGAIDATSASVSTGVISGVMRDSSNRGTAEVSIVDENWARRYVRSQIVGAVIVEETVGAAA